MMGSRTSAGVDARTDAAPACTQQPDRHAPGGGGLGKIVRAGVGRRRVQTVVMMLTTLLAVTASVLAVGLVVASSTPFQHTFDRLHGAHLTASFDPGKVTEAEVATTAHAAGVTAAAGPFRTVSLRPHTVSVHASGDSNDFSVPAGVDLPLITIVGRPNAVGTVDRLDITEGRWPDKAGEIVWADDTAPIQVGDRLSFRPRRVVRRYRRRRRPIDRTQRPGLGAALADGRDAGSGSHIRLPDALPVPARRDR